VAGEVRSLALLKPNAARARAAKHHKKNRHVGHLVESNGLAAFVPVQAASLLSKVVGETEANIAGLFRRAREAAPCVLFVDEADALAPARGTDGDSTEGTFDRVVSLLLVELDGISRSTGVCLLAATQRLHAMDPAVLRPGRLGHRILVPAPEDAAEVERVIAATLAATPVNGNRAALVSALATRAFVAGKSRAEYAGEIRRAVLAAVERGAAAVDASRDFALEL